jgi:adenylate kinase
MLRGELVPDDLVLGMVMERLGEPDAQAAFVLDGFPRNVAQAQALDRELAGAGKPLDRAVNVHVPREVLVQRLGGRWTCRECQAIYHELNNPPRVAGVCDRCGGALRQRADDRPEAVERRLEVYGEETAPVIEYYRSRGVLREVDGFRPLPQVTRELLRVLDNEPERAQV